MHRFALLFLLGCSNNVSQNDASMMGMDSSTATDAPSETSTGCGSDAGACTVTITGAVDASFPCVAKVDMPMPNTDHLTIGGGNGMVGSYTWCERFHPIQPGSLSGGCFTSVATYLPDGGIDQTFMQKMNDGKLLCASPLAGYLDVKLSNTNGDVSVHIGF